MKRLIVSMALCVPLAACSDADISAVENQQLDVDASYTVGQAFNNRKACDSVTWSTLNDDRGRKLVEYRCSFNGVEDFFASKAEKSRDKIRQSLQQKKSEYDANIKGLEAFLADAKDNPGQLPSATMGLTAMAAKKLDGAVTDYRRYLEIVKLPTLDEVVAANKDFLPESRVGAQPINWQLSMAVNDYLAAKASYERDGAVGGEAEARLKSTTDRLQQTIQLELDQIPGEIEQAEASYDRYKAPLMAQRNAEVVQAQTKLAELKASREDAFKRMERDADMQIANSDGRAKIEEVTEVFQWAVRDSAPILVYGGMELKNEGGQTRDIDYREQDVARAMQMMVSNDAEDFYSYAVHLTPVARDLGS